MLEQLTTAVLIAALAIAAAYTEGARRHRRRLEQRLRGIDGRLGRIVATTAPPTFGILPAGATWNSATDLCQQPPDGWTCTRTPGHDGPCAALPIPGVRRDGTRRELITAHQGEVVTITLDDDTAYTITRLDDAGNIVVAQAPEHDGPWTDAVVVTPPRAVPGSVQVQLPDDPIATMARARGVHRDDDEPSLDEIDVCGYTPSTADGLPCIREPHGSDNHVDATGREWTGGMAPHEREAYEFQTAVQRTIIDPPLEREPAIVDEANADPVDVAGDIARTAAQLEYQAGMERAADALDHHPGAQGHIPASMIGDDLTDAVDEPNADFPIDDEDTQPDDEPAPVVTRTIEQVQQAQTNGSLDDKLVRASCDHCDWITDAAPVMQLDQEIDTHLAECPGLADSRNTAARTSTRTKVGNDAIAEASPAIAKRASSTINQRAATTFDAMPAHDASKRRPGDDPVGPAKAILQPGSSAPAPATIPAGDPAPIPDGWATIKDAAAAIGRSDIAVHGWVTRGKLDHQVVPNPGRGKATVRIVEVAAAERVAAEAPTRVASAE